MSADARRRADLTFTVVLLVLFTGALVLARQWGFRASFVPTLVSSVGIGLTLVHLVLLLTGRSRVAVPTAADATADAEVEEHDPVHVFATAGAQRWRSSLAWVAGFFVAVSVLGLIPTTVAFTAAYLRVSARAGRRFSAIYAIAVGLVLWLVFGELLAISLPEGVFG